MVEGSSFLAFKAEALLADIQTALERPDEPTVTEGNISQERVFEDFKGACAVFAYDQYEWPVDYLLIIGEDFVIDGYLQMGTKVSEITDRKVDGDTLHLHTYSEERLGDKEKQYVIEASSIDQNKRRLQLDTGEVLYPITVDDGVETGFGHIREMSDLLGELRAYDQEVTQKVKYSNTSLLNNYSAQEIEYARVWLNTLGNEAVRELNISHIQAGDIIHR